MKVKIIAVVDVDDSFFDDDIKDELYDAIDKVTFGECAYVIEDFSNDKTDDELLSLEGW